MILRSSFVIIVFFLQLVLSQEPFFGEIDCWKCYGLAHNSTCADPFHHKEARYLPGVSIVKCKRGGCLKFTRYKNHQLYLERTCTREIEEFHLTLVDVCRHERNGNGELCMCPDDLCNTAIANTGGMHLLLAIVFIGWISS